MTIAQVGFALARYRIEDPSFHPYSSKYDYCPRGKAMLSDAEIANVVAF
ncbi:MAG TPA: hypothetical protein VGC14_16490 [Rhizobium sp.]